jgi:hypothetical protein
MTGPNFFLVGAAKAGTTSLFHYLNSHPQIFLSPIKEPNYFAKDIDPNCLRPDLRKNLDGALKRFRKSGGRIQLHIAHIVEWEEYLGLFQQSGDCKAIGECSVSYLPSTVAAENIYSYNPNSRIIIMLRNPIWRALSQYRMDRKMGSIVCDFDTAIKEDLAVKNPTWGRNRNYVWNGMYAEQIRRFMERFPEDQIHILFFEDFKHNIDGEMCSILSFLGVDRNIVMQTDKQFNQAGQPRVASLNRLIHRSGLKPLLKNMLPNTIFKRLKQLYYGEAETATLSRDQAIFLCDLYRDNVQRLSNMLAKDLTGWVDPEKILAKNE